MLIPKFREAASSEQGFLLTMHKVMFLLLCLLVVLASTLYAFFSIFKLI